MTVRNGISSKYRQTGSLCFYYRGSTRSISMKCMNEDSVALIMCEKCVYKLRILKKGSGTIGKYLFKRNFLFFNKHT